MKMSSKWQMNRAGVIDFWYYDDEFLTSQMESYILRGSNGFR